MAPRGYVPWASSGGSDLYSYLPSNVNELCALGQVTNLSEPQFSYLRNGSNGKLQGRFED